MNEDGRLPEPVSGIDLKALPIRPEEAFVLSRIDGASREADLVASTGLSIERVSKTLDRLASLGVIKFNGDPVGAEATTHRGMQGDNPAGEQLEPDLDVPPDRQRRIVETYRALELASHYELLGVAEDSDKKAIKAAYYEVVNIFHPDRYYGKRLGGLKPKLERIFAALTEAHDTLTRRARREEYDRYLAAQQRTRRYDQLLSSQAQSAAVAKARQQIEAAARISNSDGTAGTRISIDSVDLEAPRAPNFSTATMQAIGGSPQDHPSQQPHDERSQRVSVRLSDAGAGPSSSPEARRRALARKLRRSHGPSDQAAARDSLSSPLSQKEIVSHAVDDLRRRYEERVTLAQRKQISQFIEAAERSLAQNDAAAAMNSLTIAVSLAPGDKELASRLSQVKERVDRELSAGYLEQASYEERDKKWQLAARSYSRAAKGKREAKLFERAAHCLLEHYLESGEGLKSAREHAVTAVSIEPAVAQHRVTLAKILLHAGMKASAIAEFERAARLAPNDATISDWLRRAQNLTV